MQRENQESIQKINNLKLVTYPILSAQQAITHFCTTREGGESKGNYGSFNLSPFSGDFPENQSKNLQLLSKELQIELSQIIFPYQTHSKIVKIIDNNFFKLSMDERKHFLNGVDALITNIPAICIGVTTADCVPILLFDPIKKVTAAIHAGWRGTCSRIVQKSIHTMQSVYGTHPQDIVASIGVSISPNVYNVGDELIEEFKKQEFPIHQIFNRKENLLFLDLWMANKWLLNESGVPSEKIEIAGLCSFSNADVYFSARKLGIKSGRMLSGIMLK